MKIQTFSCILVVFTSCHSTGDKTSSAQLAQLKVYDTNRTAPKPSKDQTKKDTIVVLKTHLRDTVYVSENFILFLRPDDARYAELNSAPDEGISEGDADFGAGIANTEDSIKKSNKYKSVKILVSTDRYISIKDCMHGPLVIDRDSISYGYILAGKGKQIVTNFNSLHSGNYLAEIEDYFSLQK